MKIADVSRQAGLNRSTVTSLYREDATRVAINTIDKLYRLFNYQVADFFKFIKHTEDQRNSRSKFR